LQHRRVNTGAVDLAMKCDRFRKSLRGWPAKELDVWYQSVRDVTACSFVQNKTTGNECMRVPIIVGLLIGLLWVVEGVKTLHHG